MVGRVAHTARSGSGKWAVLVKRSVGMRTKVGLPGLGAVEGLCAGE